MKEDEVFLHLGTPEFFEESSAFNPGQSYKVVRLVWLLFAMDVTPKNIVILCMYNAQAIHTRYHLKLKAQELLRNYEKPKRWTWKVHSECLEVVEVNTINSYQGRECTLTILLTSR